MAIQVIDRFSRNAPQQQQANTDSSTFGGLLSTALGKGVRNLAEGKLAQLQQQRATADMSGRLEALGLSPQDANYLAALPHKEQVSLLQQIPAFSERMGGAQQQQPRQEMISQSPQEQPQPQEKKPSLLQGISTARERAAQHAEQKQIDKETLEPYREVLKSGKAARENNMRLNRMEALIKRGKLPVAATYNIFKGMQEGALGYTPIAIIGKAFENLQALRSGGDIEEFNKLSADFVRSAKDVFGSRVTDQDLKAFMQMIPSLAISDFGKMRVIQNMRAFNEAAEVRERTAKQIIAANGGRRPRNFELLVDELAGPQLDQIAQEFSSGANQIGQDVGI